jgi:hypothetical protein
MAGEKLRRLIPGKVQTAAASHEKFPPDRRFGIEERHRSAPSHGYFSRPQTGRSAADDGDSRLFAHCS